MRLLLTAALALFLAAPAWADDVPKQAPKITLKSPDGKKSIDLGKLFEQGPVLVRLTCACSGCDAELPYFQKLQAAYNAKGLQTVAVFREKPETLEQYVDKKAIKFQWLSDPSGELWKTFDSKAMPTNILIDKGGKVVRVVPGCTVDGKNAQLLSNEIAGLLNVPAAQVVEQKKK
ncbi:MAG: TlpA family protein disulfide reductase [Planctomycetes bacterium]|nr:TlpA family protein disulfide reductase [Planctomycetota bacterium]